MPLNSLHPICVPHRVTAWAVLRCHAFPPPVLLVQGTQKRRRLLTSPSTFHVLLPLLFGALWGTEVSSSASWRYDTSADQAFDFWSHALLFFSFQTSAVTPRAPLATKELIMCTRRKVCTTFFALQDICFCCAHIRPMKLFSWHQYLHRLKRSATSWRLQSRLPSSSPAMPHEKLFERQAGLEVQ